MKKLISIAVLFMFLTTMQAQKDVTQFLGIPVDGYKPEMIQKLKEKGFRSSYDNPDVLEGEFNGTDVSVHVVTNNNKVYRIALFDKNKVGETDIRIRFNRLCEQFNNNSNYISFGDYTIPEEEDISYEITVNDKRYQAEFYQQPNPNLVDTTAAMVEDAYDFLSKKYTDEQITDMSQEVLIELAQFYLSKKSVWFMISNFRGEYYIIMFYDNEYNKANGEDL